MGGGGSPPTTSWAATNKCTLTGYTPTGPPTPRTPSKSLSLEELLGVGRSSSAGRGHDVVTSSGHRRTPLGMDEPEDYSFGFAQHASRDAPGAASFAHHRGNNMMGGGGGGGPALGDGIHSPVSSLLRALVESERSERGSPWEVSAPDHPAEQHSATVSAGEQFLSELLGEHGLGPSATSEQNPNNQTTSEINIHSTSSSPGESSSCSLLHDAEWLGQLLNPSPLPNTPPRGPSKAPSHGQTMPHWSQPQGVADFNSSMNSSMHPAMHPASMQHPSVNSCMQHPPVNLSMQHPPMHPTMQHPSMHPASMHPPMNNSSMHQHPASMLHPPMNSSLQHPASMHPPITTTANPAAANCPFGSWSGTAGSEDHGGAREHLHAREHPRGAQGTTSMLGSTGGPSMEQRAASAAAVVEEWMGWVGTLV